MPRGPSIRVSSTPKPRRNPSPKRGASPTRAEEVDTDDEYEEEDTWEFDEEVDTTFERTPSKNTPRGKGVKGDTGRVAPDEVDDDEEDGDSNAVWMLNVSETRLHNVRREPFRDSPVIGHLLTETKIESIASCGDWLKVKYHRTYENAVIEEDSAGEEKKSQADVYGWCLRRKEGTTYLMAVTDDGYVELDEEIEDQSSPVRAETPYSEVGTDEIEDNAGTDSDGNDDGNEEEWYELRDDDGELYYFNSESGVSQWEPPKWFAEVDEISGVRYYVNTSTGEPQWEKPGDFVKCVREEAYSTPEAEVSWGVGEGFGGGRDDCEDYY